MSRYWLAQRVGSREWLSRDLPIEGEPSEQLSGPGSLRFTVAPEMVALETADGLPMFDAWGTYLHLEEAGEIRWSGIVVASGWEGAEWEVEAAGVSTYPHGMPYTGLYSAVKVDPAVVIRHLWEHLQEPTDARLGVEVVGSTSARVGGEMKEQTKKDANGDPVKDANGDPVKETVPVPYELAWYDYPDCGREIRALTDQAAIEWRESHKWNVDKSDVLHTIVVGDRLGAQRDDLAFEQGVNVMNPVPLDQDGDEYASEVHGIGAGEGAEALRATSARVVPNRLRRARVVLAKDVSSKARLESITRSELSVSGGDLQTTTITVVDHPHAPIGSWDLGDRIRVHADAAWLGHTSVWQRIVSTQYVSESVAVLTLAPAWE